MADESSNVVVRYFRSVSKKYTLQHLSVFTLTFFCYAFFHATRKVFPNSKPTLEEEWSPAHHVTDDDKKTWLAVYIKANTTWETRHLCHTKTDAEDLLGDLDTAFMFSYAFGLFFSGIIGDRYNPRYVLSIGMCSSAVVVFAFGCLVEWFHYYNRVLYISLWALNGLLQSSGWPTVVAVMGNWFGKSSRGFVLGLWSACASVGNIIGEQMVKYTLDFGYNYCFLVSSGVLFSGGVLMLFALVPKPTDIGLPEPEDVDDGDDDDVSVTRVASHQIEEPALETDPLLGAGHSVPGRVHRTPSIPPTHSKVFSADNDDEDPSSAAESAAASRPAPIGFFQAAWLPGVIPYSLAYASLKLVNYSFFFWLPLYLSDQYGWSNDKSNGVSVWYDVGGIIGGTIGGYISDLTRKRSPVLFILLLLSIPSLYAYQAFGRDVTVNAVLMGVVGFFIGGAANIISAAICADMGRLDELRGNSEALATVTGIVDGTGSVGAAMGQYILPWIQTTYTWEIVFWFFIFCIILTCMSVLYMITREVDCVRDWCSRWVPCAIDPSLPLPEQHVQERLPASGSNSPPLQADYSEVGA